MQANTNVVYVVLMAHYASQCRSEKGRFKN